MAVPTQPTDTTIVTEAWNKFGLTSPAPSQITRGVTWGIEFVKDKIMIQNKRWTALVKKDYPILQANTPYVVMPSDYSADMKVSIVDGFHTANVAAYSPGPPVTLTLAASENAVQVEVQGKLIFILSGTGAGQAQTCIAYNPSTKVATMDAAYGTAPDTTSVYLVESIRIPLGSPKPGWEYDSLIYPTTVMRPWMCFLEPEATTQPNLMFYPVPDKQYGCIRKYYGDLTQLDNTSAQYARMQWQFRELFVKGVFAWICQDQDDDRAQSSMSEFMAILKQKGGTSVAGYDLQSLGREVADDFGDWGTVGP